MKKKRVETVEYSTRIGLPRNDDESWNVEEEYILYNGADESMVFENQSDAERKADELNRHYEMLIAAGRSV